MLLNMLRVEGADPHFLVQSSFHQYQQEAGAPALEAQAAELVKQKDALEVVDRHLFSKNNSFRGTSARFGAAWSKRG